MSRKKMIGIIIALLFGIIIAVIIAIVSPFKNTQIDVEYFMEIKFENNVADVLPAYLLYPRLHSSTNIENIYKSYLNIIFDAANLQEESIKEIKEKIAELPKDTYIYICVGRKLKKIIYTEETDRYGWNGVYSDESYNSVFIYWGTKPLGNVVDGYV
jgi:cbb3-type cytochrome oxidase cytochrome c subunit